MKIEKIEGAYEYEMDFFGNNGFQRKPIEVYKIAFDDGIVRQYQRIGDILAHLDPPVEDLTEIDMDPEDHYSPIWSITNGKEEIRKVIDSFARRVSYQNIYFNNRLSNNNEYLEYFNTIKEQLNG